MDGETLNMLTPKMVGNRPNTYTYTKAIAEYLLQVDLGSLPVVIVRPSIVGATYQEPVKVSVYVTVGHNFNHPLKRQLQLHQTTNS